MPDFYTWAILLINKEDEISEKQLSVFGSRGGQNSPLMHVLLSSYVAEISVLIYVSDVKKDLSLQNFNSFLTCFNNVHFLREKYIFLSEYGAHFAIFTVIYSV